MIGQGTVVASLKRVVKDNRAHSFLFTGPAGVGKTTLARIVANKFAGGHATAANIKEIAAADQTGVDDMRRLVTSLLTRAIGGNPTKAVILDECHRLSGSAWDVLLKPIEEPSEHVYWMFCTTNPGKIPKTIQTRCLRYDLKPVPEDALLELLVKVADAEKLAVPDEVLEAIAESAGGSPRQALVFLEACTSVGTVGEAHVMMRSAGQSKGVIDLCRLLLSTQGRSWPEAMKILNQLEGTTDAESIRIVICNYLQTALLDAKSDARAKQILALLEPFLEAYNQSDRWAPLMHSLGLALGLDQ